MPVEEDETTRVCETSAELEEDQSDFGRKHAQRSVKPGGERCSPERHASLSCLTGNRGGRVIDTHQLTSRCSTTSIVEVGKVPTQTGRNQNTCDSHQRDAGTRGDRDGAPDLNLGSFRVGQCQGTLGSHGIRGLVGWVLLQIRVRTPLAAEGRSKELNNRPDPG